MVVFAEILVCHLPLSTRYMSFIVYSHVVDEILPWLCCVDRSVLQPRCFFLLAEHVCPLSDVVDLKSRKPQF